MERKSYLNFLLLKIVIILLYYIDIYEKILFIMKDYLLGVVILFFIYKFFVRFEIVMFCYYKEKSEFIDEVFSV